MQMLCVHTCRAVILLASQRHSGMASMNGMLEWKATGSLQRMGREESMGVLLSVSVTCWHAWSSAGMDEELVTESARL